MKKILLLMLVSLFGAVLPCYGELVDPILLDIPDQLVHLCGEDTYLEIYTRPMIQKSIAGRTAYYAYQHISVKLLFLGHTELHGLDRESFSLRHVSDDGSETLYPLNYAVSMISNCSKGYETFSEEIVSPFYMSTDLVFDVDNRDKLGWSLIFAPRGRGETEPICVLELPLNTGVDESSGL